MGDLELHVLKQNDCFADRSTSTSLAEFSNPQPSDIPEEKWRLAEDTTQKIIRRIQPTRVSEERRRNVVEFVQKLIASFLGIEVFPFGSVPLKTYLPDGDIDLTALGLPIYEDSLAGDVCAVLEGEERNKSSEFEVNDVQYIHAEVKLVKCLVRNIVVDISFNQIGGLSTLYFLEQVDGIVGKSHLFKRSIILIKAWCYYESRILGAHHSLLSTYALETLILYIFNFFHSSLDGPLVVLYKFLDYFGKFDWDNFGVSLHGPVCVTSLPDIVAEVPETEEGNLLSTEFLNRCGELCSATPRASENNRRHFVKKHLNIVDPLKENNNLGRSVSKGNLYRIRSAFSYGARKLGRILLSAENMQDELNIFFKNTLERHGSGGRPDVQDSYNGFKDSASFDFSEVSNLLSNINAKQDVAQNTSISSFEDNFYGNREIFNPQENGRATESRTLPPSRLLASNSLQGTASESNPQGNSVSEPELTDHRKYLTTINILGSRDIIETCGASPMATEASPSNTARQASHSFFRQENSNVMKEDLDRTNTCNAPSVSTESESSKSTFRSISGNNLASLAGMSNEDSSLCKITESGDISLVEQSCMSEAVSIENNLISEDIIPDECDLADLSGNRERHYRNLLRAQWYHEVIFNGPVPAANPLSPPQYDINRHSIYTNVNGVVPGPPFPSSSNYYQINHGFIPGPYSMDNMQKTRGTGTYFPNTNHCSYREKSSIGRGKTPYILSQGSRSRNNGHTLTQPESNLTAHAQAESPNGNEWGRSVHLDSSQVSGPVSRGMHHSNGVSPSECHFGSFGPVQLDCRALEPSGYLDSSSSHNHNFGQIFSSSTVRKAGINSNQESRYRLKDDDEFPPLSAKGLPNVSVHSYEHKTVWEIKREHA